MLGEIIGILIGSMLIILWVRLIVPKGQDLWDWLKYRHEKRNQRICIERYEKKRQAYLKEREEQKALTEEKNESSQNTGFQDR